VKFHDGTDFDADVVVWNIEKILNDKSPQFDPKQAAQARGRVPTLIGWKAVDKYTVELTTREVNTLFPYDMSYIIYSSPTNWEKQGKDWVKVALQPVGTGPFKVDRVVPRERLELSRFDGYWDKARVPKLDKVLLFPMPEAATRTAALLAGQVDWIEVPAPDAIPRLKQGGMSIVTNKYPHNWAYQPSMVEGSPWTDIRVRKAANLAVDRAGLTKLLGGLMMEGKGAVYPGHPWFGSPSFDIKYDPAEAKKLLAEAGYGPNKKPKIKIAISTLGLGPDVAAADERGAAGEPQVGLQCRRQGRGDRMADLAQRAALDARRAAAQRRDGAQRLVTLERRRRDVPLLRQGELHAQRLQFRAMGRRALRRGLRQARRGHRCGDGSSLLRQGARAPGRQSTVALHRARPQPARLQQAGQGLRLAAVVVRRPHAGQRRLSAVAALNRAVDLRAGLERRSGRAGAGLAGAGAGVAGCCTVTSIFWPPGALATWLCMPGVPIRT
jgi:hypothetical protein